MRTTVLFLFFICFAAQGFAENKETIETVQAYIGEQSVRVNIFCHNEEGLLEYFNLIIFDDSKLDFVSIEADRGSLWYGSYPTHVEGDRICVHGVDMGCMDPDWDDPGSTLYHIIFNVKPGVEAGFAGLAFSSEGAWDGHWNDCGGYQISPDPEYYDGGVNILGHAGHITIGDDSTNPGEQAIVDVYLHNDLDVFEYFNQILFEQAVADVDSIVPLRGTLHYGNYPTHVAGDTIFVHGWAADDDCFYTDHSYPGGPLYRIHFTLHELAPPGYAMPITYLGGDPVWDHWVGCDLYTTDSFNATDGSVQVLELTGVEDLDIVTEGIRLEQAVPNPASCGSRISYCLGKADHVTVTIYDVSGKKVRTLVNGAVSTGWHKTNWDGTDDRGEEVASGVYFCILRTETATVSRKLVLIK